MNKDFRKKAEQVFENNAQSSQGIVIEEQIRASAFQLFLENGFPTKKNEDWKYTNLNFLNNIEFEFSEQLNDSDLESKQIKDFIISKNSEFLLVFVNGFFSQKLSNLHLDGLDNVIIGSLIEAVQFDKNYHSFIGTSLDKLNDGFTLFNTSFFRDGAFVYIPENFILDKPIHVLHISDARQKSLISNQRNLILASSGSQVKFIETSYQIGDKPSFYNAITEIFADTGSVVDYYKYQNEEKELYYVGTTQVLQFANSVFNSSTFTLNSHFVRNNLNSLINGDHCEANFKGLYFLNNNEFADNHTLADHSSPNSNSNEIYRGIINDSATAVFNGKILVRPDAQKTNAYQSNKNILLSDEATINTKPQLEIFADDVKCSHGATSGTIDEESLFYLRARGISEDLARSLLLSAFADELINEIKIPELKIKIKNQISKSLNIPEFVVSEN